MAPIRGSNLNGVVDVGATGWISSESGVDSTTVLIFSVLSGRYFLPGLSESGASPVCPFSGLLDGLGKLELICCFSKRLFS